MTIQEFSDQFDVLYNNITSNQAPGLNEYEKSVFLTKAQDEVVKNHFSANSKGNDLQTGFDGSAKRQVDFSMLMRTVIADPATEVVNLHSADNTRYYVMRPDIFLFINEILQVSRGTSTINLVVIPLSFEEYNRLMSKPFKRPLKNQAWRLINTAGNAYSYTDYDGIATILKSISTATGVTKNDFYNAIYEKHLGLFQGDEGDILAVDNSYIAEDASLVDAEESAMVVESQSPAILALINTAVPSSYPVVELIPGNGDRIIRYIIRYVAKPEPIILTNLHSEGLTINGEENAQTCKLDPILHEEVLQRAVELAKIAWTATGNDNAQTVVQAGQRSE